MVSVKIGLDKIIVPPFYNPHSFADDFHLGHFFFTGFDFDLPEDDFDGFGVVIFDEIGVAELVDKEFTASCKIVGIEE